MGRRSYWMHASPCPTCLLTFRCEDACHCHHATFVDQPVCNFQAFLAMLMLRLCNHEHHTVALCVLSVDRFPLV